MKGLLSVLLLGILLLSLPAMAGPLELALGAGPSFAALDSVNDSIGVFNALLAHLNETFDVHPDVTGTIAPMPLVGRGLFLSGAERYWLTDWFGFGAHIDYFGASSRTSGFYQGDAVSRIDLAYALDVVSASLAADVAFVDLGIRIGASAGVGVHYGILDQTVVFEIPEEYPDVIAGIPPEGESRFTGSGLGFEAGVFVAYPITEWLIIGTRVGYRSANIAELTNEAGLPWDPDGDDRANGLNLTGFTVQISFSIAIDLSLDGGKESVE